MTLARYRLVKHTTDDWLCSFLPHVPLGTVYSIDLRTIETVQMRNLEKDVDHQKVIARTPDGRWLPLECLELVTLEEEDCMAKKQAKSQTDETPTSDEREDESTADDQVEDEPPAPSRPRKQHATRERRERRQR